MATPQLAQPFSTQAYSNYCNAFMNKLYPPNQFNDCLADRESFQRMIVSSGGLHTMCAVPGMKQKESEFIMRREDQEFKQQAAITLPVGPYPSLANEVLVFRVPLGYSGVLTHSINVFTGTGLVEGSGDLTWHLQVGDRFPDFFGNLLFQQGSATGDRYVIPGAGIQLESGQLIRWTVDVNGPAPGPTTARIICGAFGWFRPRR